MGGVSGMARVAAKIDQSVKLSPGDFTRLSRLIYDTCGIKMSGSKKTMLESRLHKRLRALSMGSFADYCAYLFGPAGAEEMIHMIDIATTNKTDFFREPDHFDYLVSHNLLEWLQKAGNRGGGRLKVWSAGCSSGEEPYTLAMVLSEFFAGLPVVDFRILATDISTQVLEKAYLGVYPEERIAAVPPHMRHKYLLRSRDRSRRLVRVVPELRGKVQFRRLNLMDDEYGFREQMDVIFCRNVVIYFDRPTQERLLKRFCRYLAPGGHLFMGHSETLNGMDVPLVQVCPTVYRKPA
jgi:chemotaxis protein methyltransferase CheR